MIDYVRCVFNFVLKWKINEKKKLYTMPNILMSSKKREILLQREFIMS